MSYFPIGIRSHYSLLLGLSKPKQIAQRLKTLGLSGGCLIDNNLAGSIEYYKSLKKENLKPIIGVRFNTDDNEVIFIALNKNGWKELLEINFIANNNAVGTNDNKNIKILFDNLGQYQNIAIILKSASNIDKWSAHFDKQNIYADNTLSGLPYLPICESLYPNKEDAFEHRISLATGYRTKLSEIVTNSNGKFNDIQRFFDKTDFFIHSYEEQLSRLPKEHLMATLTFADKCEDINPLQDPKPPLFTESAEKDAELLRQYCRDGWKNKIQHKIPKEQQTEYGDRVKYELGLLQSVGLSGYFLIVKDILATVKYNGHLTGVGRGSAAGCLVSYLINITGVDPIKYHLLFERFYNSGRNTANKVSLPDIDMDVPISQKDSLVQYIKDKYGKNNVAQMVTFQTMKGRGAIKDVLRAYDSASFSEMNNITEFIPDEAAIADELQEMKDESGESSIIKWALENRGDKLRQWCYLTDDGTLDGPLAKRFEQAIRLEGTKVSQSKHAAGVIISNRPIKELAPVIYDEKTDSLIAGIEMKNCEEVGLIKFDVLGLAALDKLETIRDMLANECLY